MEEEMTGDACVNKRRVSGLGEFDAPHKKVLAYWELVASDCGGMELEYKPDKVTIHSAGRGVVLGCARTMSELKCWLLGGLAGYMQAQTMRDEGFDRAAFDAIRQPVRDRIHAALKADEE